MNDLDIYLNGKRLYGDEFSAAEIDRWFQEEKQGYFDLADGSGAYDYAYHALNRAHGFRYLGDGRFGRCLALGCARGDELLPIASRIGEVVALEPAEQWWSGHIGGSPTRYLKPVPSGQIALEDDSVDLITCFGVLHHIPNVTAVIGELARVARPGAIFLLREPMHSMGDWRKPRKGLTKNERGLPEKWMERTLASAGFTVERKARCIFSPLATVAKKTGISAPLNHAPVVALDRLASWLTGGNRHYWRDRPWKKIAPSSIFWVLKRD